MISLFYSQLFGWIRWRWIWSSVGGSLNFYIFSFYFVGQVFFFMKGWSDFLCGIVISTAGLEIIGAAWLLLIFSVICAVWMIQKVSCTTVMGQFGQILLKTIFFWLIMLFQKLNQIIFLESDHMGQHLIHKREINLKVLDMRHSGYISNFH